MVQTFTPSPDLLNFVLGPRAGWQPAIAPGSDAGSPPLHCEPVFIVGAPRSGTSIFTWCLGQHPNILCQEESVWSGIFAYFLQGCYLIGSARGERSQLSSMGITRDALFETVGDAINSMILAHRGEFENLANQAAVRKPEGVNDAFSLARDAAEPKRRWVDGTPENSFYIPAFRRMFPRARFIHIVRDVDAVVKSLLNFVDDQGQRVVSNEAEAYSYWQRTVSACVEAEQAYGSEVVLRIHYRDLVHSGEATLRRCFAFLDEPFSQACLEPLGTRINSSRVSDDFDPFDSATDPNIREISRELSRRLLADERPCCAPDYRKMEALEQDFVARARHMTRASADLNKALVCLAEADRELALLRGTTPDEAARELVRRHTAYNALVVVGVPAGRPAPYLDGREPLPVVVPRPEDREGLESLLAQIASFPAAGVTHLLLPDLVRNLPGAEPRLAKCLASFRAVESRGGWTFYST